jgi:hypothetical protein
MVIILVKVLDLARLMCVLIRLLQGNVDETAHSLIKKKNSVYTHAKSLKVLPVPQN